MYTYSNNGGIKRYTIVLDTLNGSIYMLDLTLTRMEEVDLEDL